MKRFNLFFGLCIVAFTVLLVYSCAKESGSSERKDQQENLDQRFQNKVVTLVERMDLKSTVPNNTLGPTLECKNTDPNCFGPYLDTITVLYRGCPFTVIGEVSFCLDLITGNTYISIGSISGTMINWLDPNCSPLVSEWLTLWATHQWEILNDSIDICQYTIEKEWEEDFVNRFILNNPSHSYYCDQPEIDANVIVEHYKGTCYQRCINSSKEGGLIWRDIRCGYGCCKRTTHYCIDRKTEEIVSTTKIEVIKNCNYDPEPNPGCKYLSECRQNCSKIR